MCQKNHWPTHKSCCKKTASELPVITNTVVYNILRLDGKGSKYGNIVSVHENSESLIKCLEKQTPSSTKHSQFGIDFNKKDIINPYGDSTFVVKLQIPLKEKNGDFMIYDQFHCVINRTVGYEEDTWGYDEITRLCQTGIHRFKVYLFAKVEGFNVRIYLGPDKPSQIQSW